MSSRKINQKLEAIEASPIRIFNDRISHVEGLVKFTIGEPDFNTPLFIREAAVNGIMNQSNGYTHSKGTIELRQAARDYLNRHYHLDYDIDDLIITIGATEALYTSFFTLLNPGDKVLIASPHYPVYVNQIQLNGGIPVVVDVSQTGFIWTPDVLEEACIANPQAKVLLLNYPSNPTGISYREDELKALINVIEKYDLWVISDEIYSALSYDYQHVSMANFLPDRTLLVNGASKSHSMTGWRIGILAGPPEVMNRLYIIHQGTVNTPATQSQYAALAALSLRGDESIYEMKGEYDKRRKYLVESLSKIGFIPLDSNGAFYLFIKIPDWYSGDDFDFCLLLAEEEKIGVTPGQAFGQAGKGYFRVSYASSHADLEFLVRTLTNLSQKYQ